MPAVAKGLGSAYGEGLIAAVEHGMGAAGGAQIGDAVEVGHGRGEGGRGRGVAGVKDGGAADGAHHGEVFDAHLGGAVGADLDAAVGTAQRHGDLGDGRHADEVVGAGEEGGEGRGVGTVAADGHADGVGDHLLFGDVGLEVPLRVGLLEGFGMGGVADLGWGPRTRR